MASQFFESFLPLATQSLAQAGPAALQGQIQGEDLALDRQLKQAQAQHYGNLGKHSAEMQRLEWLKANNPMMYMEVVQNPDKYPYFVGTAGSQRVQQEKPLVVPAGATVLPIGAPERTGVTPFTAPTKPTPETTDQRNAAAMGLSLSDYYRERDRRMIAAKLDPDAKLSPSTVTFMAEQLLSGDPSVLTNLGRGMQGGRNVTAVREEAQRLAKQRGTTPAEVALAGREFQGLGAAERALGTRTATFGMAKSEAYQMADIVLQTSDAFDRSAFPGVNKAIQFFEKNTGDVGVRQFGAAINSFINAYARAISPTGAPTVSDKDHAREILSTADSKEQVRGLIDILKQEMDAAGKAPGLVKQELREGFSGRRPSLTEKPKMPVPSKTQAQTQQKPTGTALDWYKSLPQDTQSVLMTYYKNWKSGNVGDDQFRNDALSIIGDMPETRAYLERLMAMKQR